MNQKLKQAMDATRSGHKKKAQLLLSQLLQENPNETQAWYLLSLLVDSKSKKASYLEKVITLNPSHQKAQAQLAQLNPATTESGAIFVSPSTSEVDIVTSSEETTPDWMEALKPEADDENEETLPNWLKEPVQDNWIESEQPTLISESANPSLPVEAGERLQLTESTDPEEDKVVLATTNEKPTPKSDSLSDTAKAESPARMNVLLFVLIVGAIVTFIMLMFMLFTTYFSG